MFGSQGPGRSGAAPDRHRVRLGRQSREGRHLSQRHAGQNDGTTIYQLNVKDVPVDGFWSISVYNAQGYFEKNAFDAYTLNNITAKKDADGSVTVQFGGCDGKIPNCLPIMTGLELHGAALSPARRNPERHLEIPRGAAGN